MQDEKSKPSRFAMSFIRTAARSDCPDGFDGFTLSSGTFLFADAFFKSLARMVARYTAILVEKSQAALGARTPGRVAVYGAPGI
jgi:hypothetical protein